MKKVRTHGLQKKKERGEKIVMLTAYDAITARLVEDVEADILLVGDSLGMTSLGFKSTLDVTLDMMIHHCAAVARGASRPFLVGDMPFMSYKVSIEQALTNAARMIQEGAMEAVKVEGGEEMAPTVSRLVAAGIPVMAHIGLTPQSFHVLGGFRQQGVSTDAADRLLSDARALEQAGAFSIVLEMIPDDVAGRISEALTIPTIGIAAGPACDGQVLVIADILGMSGKTPYAFVKQYANLYDISSEALKAFSSDVREGKYPQSETN